MARASAVLLEVKYRIDAIIREISSIILKFVLPAKTYRKSEIIAKPIENIRVEFYVTTASADSPALGHLQAQWWHREFYPDISVYGQVPQSSLLMCVWGWGGMGVEICRVLKTMILSRPLNCCRITFTKACWHYIMVPSVLSGAQ